MAIGSNPALLASRCHYYIQVTHYECAISTAAAAVLPVIIMAIIALVPC
jgi:hypothetical protein